MNRAFGIETEYGITVLGAEALDVVHESIEIVRSYADRAALMKWDYAQEDPHRDARGFRAAGLLQDTDESAYFEIDRNRPLSFEEIKSDLALSNGARFYNDHAHPEYSTPECTRLREIVAHDKAGERILEECARRRNEALGPGQEVRLYKNNTDFLGHSYGCHDNYLMLRSIPWDRIVRQTVPFLVTRQIFAGAGKLGCENEGASEKEGVFQVSQRADFFTELVGIDTMNRRPIINTRDEPHADREKWRRFHVIIGDANMSEFATALKIGTTALVLRLIENDAAPALELADPIAAVRQISRDPSRTWVIELRDGRKISAIDVQRLYLEAALDHAKGNDPEIDWITRSWEEVLNDLQEDPMRCVDRVDWVAKFFLLGMFREEQGLEWSDRWLQSLDLEYHDVSLARGLFYEMARSGGMRRMVDEEDVKNAVFQPPTTTRAFFRGRAVAKFRRQIESIQWDEVSFRAGRGTKTVQLPEIAALDGPARELNEAIEKAASADDLANLIF